MGQRTRSALTQEHPGAGRLEVMSFNCAPFNELAPHELGITYWFAEPPESGGTLSVRLEGRREGVDGAPGSRDRFTFVAALDEFVPGAGPVALTTRIGDITAGQWQVTAEPVRPGRPRADHGHRAVSGKRRRQVVASGGTAFAPFARVRAPGVRLGAWPLLVTVGALVALAVQGWLATGYGVPAARLALLTVLGCLVGVGGGKMYYRLTHRGDRASLLRTGMSIQGFVLASVSTLVFGAAVAGWQVGPVLDVSVPGLMFGMSVGRWGCFLGGCCAGRATGSRWGLWSSDRHLGMRRVPVQLLESAVAGGLGVLSAGLVLQFEPQPAGAVFAGTVAAYVLARQLLFPLRSVPRLTAHGLLVNMVVASAVLGGAVVMALVG